jgi:pilus assembly protein CpaC
VVVARVARSELRQMGFGFFENGQHHKFDSTLGQSFAANAIATPIFPNETNSLVSGGANLILGFVNDEQEFIGFLQALRTEGLAKILAEPRLVALSGRPASFLDGGEQAVPIPAGLGQVGVQFEEFGTRLNFIPVVLGNGKIHLEVEPEVSNLDPASGVNIQGTVVPGRITQRVHTTVEMEDGQTLLIGGLIQHTVNAQDVKVPVVGDLPFIGAAFSSKSFNEEEHELVVLVTPHLVDPMSCDQLPKYLPGQETRSPDDFELFLEGILEAPHGPRNACQDHHYVPAYKNGPTAGQFPCAGGHCGGQGAFCSGGCAGGSCGGGCGGGPGVTDGTPPPPAGPAGGMPVEAASGTAPAPPAAAGAGGTGGDAAAGARPAALPAATADADHLK